MLLLKGRLKIQLRKHRRARAALRTSIFVSLMSLNRSRALRAASSPAH